MKKQNHNPMDTIKAYKDTSYTLKSKTSEFLGVAREFSYFQADILAQFKRNNDIKHIRDNGDLKEFDITNFLQANNLIPKKYGVSGNKIRIASPSGHISKEMDIVFYDYFNNIDLMNRKGQYRVFPVETVYGVMQVKSKLTKAELKKGLENIASYKRLKRKSQPSGISRSNPISNRGFGILFAYDSDMEWKDIVKEIETFAKNNPKEVWCNSIVILNRGVITHGNKELGGIYNFIHENTDEVQIYGNDTSLESLYILYTQIMELLRTTQVQNVDIVDYYVLPYTSGEYSYKFEYGEISEFFRCQKHGVYLKKIKPEALENIITYCKNIQPVDLWQAMGIEQQPREKSKLYQIKQNLTYIYNPENLDYQNILFKADNSGFLAIDIINCQDMRICIPDYYANKYAIFEVCPKCKKKSKSNKK